ncbi:hypothetical protein WG66_002250 [Moniliophthora roreri]|nr:hypothetical protein WG66_002250 [Moniliophthora roreri]
MTNILLLNIGFVSAMLSLKTRLFPLSPKFPFVMSSPASINSENLQFNFGLDGIENDEPYIYPLPRFQTGLGGYMEWPNKKVLTILRARPEWGLTATVANNPNAMKIIKKRIGSRLIHHRNDAKEIIGASMGKYVAETKTFEGESLVRGIGGKQFELTLTVAHLARIAFIRSIYRSAIKVSTDGKVDQAFWRTVDTTLRAVREEKQNDAARISRRVSQTDHITVFLLTHYMARDLEQDRSAYGHVINALPPTTESFNG